MNISIQNGFIYVDGVQVGTVEQATVSTPNYLIFDLACAGSDELNECFEDYLDHRDNLDSLELAIEEGRGFYELAKNDLARELAEVMIKCSPEDVPKFRQRYDDTPVGLALELIHESADADAERWYAAYKALTVPSSAAPVSEVVNYGAMSTDDLFNIYNTTEDANIRRQVEDILVSRA